MRLFALSLAGFLTVFANSPALAAQEEPDNAVAYVETFLDIVHREAWTGDGPEWPALAQAARRDAALAEDALATYPILERVIRGIGDHHGGLQVSPEREAEYRRRFNGVWYTPPTANPTSRYMGRTQQGFRDLTLTNGKIVRILTVPRLFANEDGQAYARPLFDAASDPMPGICAFMVDLRGNIGGTMWPMLAAVSPLLGEGDIGAFTRRSGAPQAWRLASGATGSAAPGEPYKTYFNLDGWRSPPDGRDTIPVAVLMDDGTISAGEALAVAFRGRPNTRSFGGPTFGLSSNNTAFPLADGISLFIVTGLYQDRTGRSFPSGLTPDVTVDPEAPPVEGLSAAAVAARNWLADQPGCRTI